MSDVGKPISDDVRQTRNFKQLLDRGIKMMVRRDMGGIASKDYVSTIRKRIDGLSYAEISEFIDAELYKLKDGIKERQSHTVSEIERRYALLAYRSGIIEMFGDDDTLKYKLLHDSVNCFLGGNFLVLNYFSENDLQSSIVDKLKEISERQRLNGMPKVVDEPNNEYPPE